jgi:hypothetical protein
MATHVEVDAAISPAMLSGGCPIKRSMINSKEFGGAMSVAIIAALVVVVRSRGLPALRTGSRHPAASRFDRPTTAPTD